MNATSDRLTRRGIPSTLNANEHSKIPAWFLSVVLHTLVLLALAFFSSTSPKGTGGERGRPVGLAVVVDNAGKESYFLPSGSDSSSSSASGTSGATGLASLPDAGGGASTLASELQGLLPSTDSGGSSAATGEIGLGGGNSQLSQGGSGAKGSAPLFGIEGKGSRFIYVFDRSDSMNSNEGKPLRRAKDELIKSIRSLTSALQFHVIFYNDHPHPFGGSKPRLLYGEDRDKESAIRFVKDMTGIGSTNHYDALVMALSMNPDVIFFLTDADDSPGAQKLNRIADRADRIGATIHCIQFGIGQASFQSSWINQLAERTGGKFMYIDVNQL